MPPAKRKPAQQAPAAAASLRVTRAAAKRSALAISDPPLEEKKAKKAKKAKAKTSSGGRKKKNEKEESASVKADKEEEIEEDVEGASSKTIFVEHCKQCNQFKMRANLVKERLEGADCGVNVILNPEKTPAAYAAAIVKTPLTDMKRPFKPMRDLDMDKVISDIIDEISNT
ncbi:uncharacterized protein HKW66_Vig0225980 [Vigna angularis]|uniref:Selenoprotein H n=1 Tax=Phaseolus angularis TaxID=3914 RepID=A0A8T0JZ40_PHAAN|nr:uncharacterized protein HKW66_Vig0225980 [Vigna angularis]